MTVLKNRTRYFVNGHIVALLVSGVLVACGGGGSTANSPTAPAPNPTPVVVAASLITTVPAANYTGEQAAAYTLINAQRSTCGFGLLAQNTALDAAAASHVAYFSVSVAGTDAHTEIVGQTGFTGVTPTDRAVAKGYVGQAGEVAAIGTAVGATRILFSAPYHLRGLMDGYRDIGIAVGTGAVVRENNYFVGDLGNQTNAGLQLLAGTDVMTYPCDGTTGVNYLLVGETPNPVPGLDLYKNPIGTPILIKVRDGNVLTVTSATMSNKATGASVTLRPAVTAANDPNRVNGMAYYKASEAYVAPDAPLSPGTQYQAVVVGTNNGVPFSRTINFTTGTGVN
jgi:uncharacterized protein YkwD